MHFLFKTLNLNVLSTLNCLHILPLSFTFKLCDNLEIYGNILQAKSDLLGFVWTGINEVVYVTAKGIEQYQVCNTFLNIFSFFVE